MYTDGFKSQFQLLSPNLKYFLAQILNIKSPNIKSRNFPTH